MMSQAPYSQKLLLGLVLLVICTTIFASSPNRERRHIGIEESDHRQGRIQTSGSRSFKSSTSKNNEITAEPGRKVSHRLIGGHLRVDTKRERDETLWDDGILMSSAGNGKEGKNTRGDEDDEKKTLSQQVKEGKYGLIQNEIYKNRPKRPGIISYLGNPEVPKDTVHNLGGLDEDEIWLAENHVLVLRGGKFPGHEAGQGSGDSAQQWPPIDDYKAPKRQVKIPSRPKIPPPFPVQLTEGGPIQIIGPNGTKEVSNATFDYKKDPLYTKGLLPGEGPFFTITSNGTILSADFDDQKNFTIEEKSNQGQKKINPDLAPPTAFPPFYHAIPPGAVFVPPPSNQTDYDDDDQSIYYPPPYSFHYKQENSTAVPPGPLVPGIILPPPPDFFSALDDKKTTTKKYTKRPGTTPYPRLRPTYLPPRKLSTKHYKISTTVPPTETKTTAALPITTKIYDRTTRKNGTTTLKSNTVHTIPYIEVTTPTPDKPTTLDNPEFYSIGPIGNQVSEASTEEKSRNWSGLVNSKTVPIAPFYPTGTQSTLEKPVEVTPASIKNIITTSRPGRIPSQASYYFYEESAGTAGNTNPSALFYKTTTESPYFSMQSRKPTEEGRKQYYSVETVPSQETSKDFNAKYVESVVKNTEDFRYTEPEVTSAKYEKYDNTRSQSQRMLQDHTPIYYPSISSRPAITIQPYYTTPKPQSYYRQDAKPKPVYQYSFEATGYSKRAKQGHEAKESAHSVPYNEYHDYKSNNHQYDYEEVHSIPEQRLRQESVSYKSQPPVYSSTTGRTILSTTQNPHHSYFTHQEETLLDDVTKEYFTIFGKKLSGKGLPSTTPLYGKSSVVTERPEYNLNRYVSNNYKVEDTPAYKTPNVKVHYGDQQQRPYSLKDDTLVNYRKPLPPINPDSEFITVVDPKHQQIPLQRYRMQGEEYGQQDRSNERLTPIRSYTSQRIIEHANGPPTNYVPILDSPEELDETYPQRPLSLADDIEVNYRDPRPTINPDAEFIDPISVHDNRAEKQKAYFAYRLPGDGGHFYFLTPQAITQRPEQNGGYVYPKSRGSRLLRRRRRPGNV